MSGLSPPTRGNLCESSSLLTARRSIPAHAGEPASSSPNTTAAAVYPRPRGGTDGAIENNKISDGLSPPTRGNRVRAPAGTSRRRSIPAHAGEPSSCDTCRSRWAVYPRPRGGTSVDNSLNRMREGLSPPTRGNPPLGETAPPPARSIPAHAGEPSAPRPAVAQREVYPRPRGGTAFRRGRDSSAGGLSPPTRGNLHVADAALRVWRSIPAHAGEPTSTIPPRILGRVYPRPRGGTVDRTHNDVVAQGLSPPTRGNHLAGGAGALRLGSIPAHAGEPSAMRRLAAAPRVYPRPRGGTRFRHFTPLSRRGLSPPTRGNPPRRAPRGANARSIPAHAGEPLGTAAQHEKRRVYPRPRGGT